MNHAIQNMSVSRNLRRGISWFIGRELIPYWILLIFVISFITFVRIHILSTPLERDEGEYAYMGQLLLQGVLPFKEAFNMKLPGTSMMYALFMLLFGQNISAIHLGLLIVNFVSMFFIFLIAKKMLDIPSAIVSSISFAFLSVHPLLLGFAAHATHFVILFALGGFYFLFNARKPEKSISVFFAGILFGCAFLMKQPGIFFVFFGLSVLGILGIKEHLTRKQIFWHCGTLVFGFVIPVLLILLVIYLAGTFDRFCFWIVQYAFYYGTDISISQGMLKLSRMLFWFWDDLALFCILIVLGIVLVLAGKVVHSTKNILLSYFLFSLFTLVPGLQFRDHYFVLVLPASSFFIGCGFHVVSGLFERNPRWVHILSVIVMLVVAENVYANRTYYFASSPQDIVKKYYTINHFAESIPLSTFLIERTLPNERIAVIGSEPQIFFYTKRRSVSGHIYMYGMMEPQPFARRMQEEFIADVERAQSNYIIFFGIPCSWGDDLNSDRYIYTWIRNFTAKYYNLVGVVDLLDIYTVRYFWGEEARDYTPIAQNSIYVYERIGVNSILAPSDGKRSR